MQLIDLSTAHEDFILAGYDSITSKTHFFYIVGAGHRANIEPVQATDIANDLVATGLAAMAATKDRIKLTDAGRASVRKIRERRANIEARRGRGREIFLVALGTILGVGGTLLASYLAKRW